jgi:hypothetical protein
LRFVADGGLASATWLDMGMSKQAPVTPSSMNDPLPHYDTILVGAGQIGDPLGRALARAGH